MSQVTALGLGFCSQTTTDGTLVGQGTFYPLGFSKEELITLYWKNKTYSCSYSESATITGTLQEPNPDPPPDTITCDLSFTTSHSNSGITSSVSAQSETNLVCGNDNTFSFDMGFRSGTTTDSCGDPYDEGIEDVLSLVVNFSSVYLYGGLYYPYIYFTNNNTATSNKDTEDLNPVLTFNGSLTFCGKSINLYTNWNDVRMGWDGASATLNLTYTIAVSDTWPYTP
jgi:hypothetical protein